MKRSIRPDERCLPAFTLVELIVVIVIIALLISILVPAVGQARKVAREAVSRSVLGTLGTGLETFNADGRVGGGYPPSTPDLPASANGRPQDQNRGTRQAMSPYTNDLIWMHGAGLLVWGLAGGDLQGTPGFKVFDTQKSTAWSEETGNKPGDAYDLDEETFVPKRARSGPYVDLAKIAVTRRDGNTGFFPIPAEEEAREARGAGTPAQREYPMFLDGFGFPVLYWRADPAGVQISDRKGMATGTKRGVYHWGDNGMLVENIGPMRLILRGDRPTNSKGGDVEHLLNHPSRLDNTAGGGSEIPDVEAFPGYIINLDVLGATGGRKAPHKKDSYLLITPGEDGVYGTADDIANFDHNGR